MPSRDIGNLNQEWTWGCRDVPVSRSAWHNLNRTGSNRLDTNSRLLKLRTGRRRTFYVDKEDPEDIATKFCCLRRNDDLRARMSQANMQEFIRCHAVERFSRNMQQVFTGGVGLRITGRFISERSNSYPGPLPYSLDRCDSGMG